MSDGITTDVARNKKEILLKKLLPYKECLFIAGFRAFCLPDYPPFPANHL